MQAVFKLVRLEPVEHDLPSLPVAEIVGDWYFTDGGAR